MATFMEKKEELSNYSVEALLSIAVPSIRFYYMNGQYAALCPFHGDEKLGNFGYNPHKNCWKCFSCGMSGSGVYSLAMKVNNWGFKQTIEAMYEMRHNASNCINDTVPASMISHKKKVIKPISQAQKSFTPVTNERIENKDDFKYQTANSDVAHRVFTAFAAASPLSVAEAESLCIKRGLYKQSASHFFRFPSAYREDFWYRFQNELRKASIPGESLYHKLLGVPGFFWDKEQSHVSFVGYAGSVGILNHNKDGEVNGIELRLRNPENGGSRYMPMSSNGICLRYPERFSDGSNLGTIVDVVEPTFATTSDMGIAITEGKFKALHLSYMGYRVLNIHGISNWRSLLPALSDLDAGPITIAFDADSRSNPAVAACSLELGTTLLEQGYSTHYMTWPTKYGKGIDDVVNAGWRKSINIVEGERFIRTTLGPFMERASARRALKQSASICK